MADNEDDVELELEDQSKVPKVVRPERRIELLSHDTRKEKTEAIIEVIQASLDYVQATAKTTGEEYHHKDVAARIKQTLDAKFKGTWHVIAGKHFSGNVSHDADSLVNVKIDGLYYLVMCSGPPDRPLTGDQVADQADGADGADD